MRITILPASLCATLALTVQGHFVSKVEPGGAASTKMSHIGSSTPGTFVSKTSGPFSLEKTGKTSWSFNDRASHWCPECMMRLMLSSLAIPLFVGHLVYSTYKPSSDSDNGGDERTEQYISHSGATKDSRGGEEAAPSEDDSKIFDHFLGTRVTIASPVGTIGLVVALLLGAVISSMMQGSADTGPGTTGSSAMAIWRMVRSCAQRAITPGLSNGAGLSTAFTMSTGNLPAMQTSGAMGAGFTGRALLTAFLSSLVCIAVAVLSMCLW